MLKFGESVYDIWFGSRLSDNSPAADGTGLWGISKLGRPVKRNSWNNSKSWTITEGLMLTSFVLLQSYSASLHGQLGPTVPQSSKSPTGAYKSNGMTTDIHCKYNGTAVLFLISWSCSVWSRVRKSLNRCCYLDRWIRAQRRPVPWDWSWCKVNIAVTYNCRKNWASGNWTVPGMCVM